MAEKKEKRYVSDNVQLMSEWNWEKNSKLQFDPAKLTCGSCRKVWWRCAKGHEWQADIHNRSAGNGCPYCSKKGVISGKNGENGKFGFAKAGATMPTDVVLCRIWC